MKKKAILICLVLLCTALSSCASNEAGNLNSDDSSAGQMSSGGVITSDSSSESYNNNASYNDPTDPSYVFVNNGISVTDTGAFILGGEMEPLLYYYDSASNDYFPYCAKPDCDHQPGNETCTSVLLGRDSGGFLALIKDEIRYLKLLNGKGVFCQGDVTGENVRDVWTFDMKEASGIVNGMVFTDNKVIFVISQVHTDEIGQMDGFLLYLESVDLDNGSLSVIEEGTLTFHPTAFQIIGYDQEEVYYAFWEGNGILPEGAIFAWNTVTGEKRRISLQHSLTVGAKVNHGHLAYLFEDEEQMGVAVQDLKDDHEVAVIEGIRGNEGFFLRSKDVIVHQWDEDEWFSCSYTDGKLEKIRDKSGSSRFSILFDTGFGYVVVIGDTAQDYGRKGYLSYEQFEKGDMPSYFTASYYDNLPEDFQPDLGA